MKTHPYDWQDTTVLVGCVITVGILIFMVLEGWL